MAHSSKVLPDPPDSSRPPVAQLPSPGATGQGENLDFQQEFHSPAERLDSNDLALDLILHDIAERARQSTGATGAAIALERDGIVVCRASAGATAPDLGVKINTSSGLSGACVRTGETQWCSDTETDNRVDAEASRQLGVRSIIVVPLFAGGLLAGVIEVFSPRRGAFGEGDLQTLQDLGQWVAEALQGASGTAAARQIPVSAVPVPAQTKAQSKVRPWLRIASRQLSTLFPRSNILRTGLIVLAIVICSLLAFRWGWRMAHSGKTVASAPPTAIPPQVAPVVAAQPQSIPSRNPSGDAANAAARNAPGKPTPLIHPGSLVVYDKGSIIYRQAPGKGQPAGSQAAPDLAAISAALAKQNPASVSTNAPGAQTGIADGRPSPDSSKASAAATSQPTPPVTLPASSMLATSTTVAEVIAAPANIPSQSPTRISQGVRGGRLTRRVNPSYPPQALLQRVEGSVRLQAKIGKDGRVRDVKALNGNSYLAAAAIDAVKQWRYEPYTLNGDPVEMNTEVTVNFNLPK
jgi:TonB family protein